MADSYRELEETKKTKRLAKAIADEIGTLWNMEPRRETIRYRTIVGAMMRLREDIHNIVKPNRDQWVEIESRMASLQGLLDKYEEENDGRE